MKISEEITTRSEKLQQDCHNFINQTQLNNDNKKEPSYNDIQTIWLFTKLAELELKLESIKNINTFKSQI